MQEISQSQFQSEVLDADQPVLVKFGTSWCAPCKQLQPVLEAVEAQTKGQVKFVTIDVENARDLAVAQRIRAVPTLILFKDGQRLGERIGMSSQIVLAHWIVQLLLKEDYFSD